MKLTGIQSSLAPTPPHLRLPTPSSGKVVSTRLSRGRSQWSSTRPEPLQSVTRENCNFSLPPRRRFVLLRVLAAHSHTERRERERERERERDSPTPLPPSSFLHGVVTVTTGGQRNNDFLLLAQLSLSLSLNRAEALFPPGL